MSRTKQLIQSSAIVMLLYGLSKVTGFARLLFISRTFGTGSDADAFTAANQLPELFYVLVAGGALSAALIPVYSQYLHHKEPAQAKQSSDLASTTMTLVIIALILICGLCALFSPAITTHILVPNFTPEKQLMTAQLMRVILLNTILFGISGVISSLLNAHQHFILPAAAPIALDIGYLIGIFLLVPTFGVFGLAWGTVIGALLHIAIQLPGLWHYRLILRPRLALGMQGVHQIIRLMGPRLVMLGAIQLADIFIIRVASSLPEGAVSAYFYAYSLMQLPETLFGTAIAIVVFPTLSELFNKKQLHKMKALAMQTLRIIWLLTIPSAALLILIGRPTISLILEGGQFDADSTTLVYRVLLFFSFRIVAEATLEIVARLLYAQHNTLTPMYAYLVWLLVNVVFVYLLFEPMGIAGIALASTIAFVILSLILLIVNQRIIGRLFDRLTITALGRAAIATIVMSASVWGLQYVMITPLLYVLSATIIGIFVYIVTYLLMGGRELHALMTLFHQSS